MNAPLVLPNSTILDVLGLDPAVPRLLVDLGTACVGCSLMRFCTVEDVARVYGFGAQDLIHRLQRACASMSYPEMEDL